MRIKLAAGAALLVAATITWEYLNGGVLSHHLLAQPDLPSISNWWGLATLPALAWFLGGRMERRSAAGTRAIPAGFALALLFGIGLSAFFRSSWPEAPGYMVMALPLIALAYPIYRAECVLGFVAGMCFVFGPILPMIAACIFAAVGALFYHVPRYCIAIATRRRKSA
ncbi:hypothetical protein GTP41_13005 [Pseudoduganella sp. DS3]|uniref:Uncharacterized protein n=1 Tax=Pseudoduganella guangdongensis TaxID=2692179 RepID=A0A6N9HHC2_9BURK|nr:hypothetical protein [Pseudoduganella guangdongensis]MYN03021.1 hypothetical protein [Pseudoduganella guangdongensis]